METVGMLPEYFNYERFIDQAPRAPRSKGKSLQQRIVASLAYQADLIQALEPGVLVGRDPEFLHQFRVNIRRSRAIAEALQSALGAQPLRKGVKGLKRQARATSHLRDLDVFLKTLADWQQEPQRRVVIEASGAERIVRASQHEEHRRLQEVLAGTRYRRDMARWFSLVRDGAIDDVARRVRRKRIRKALHKQIAVHDHLLGALTRESPDSDFHSVRKSLKRIRYLIELDPERLAPGVKKLKSRQKHLGRFQDRHVQITLLETVVAPALDEHQRSALEDLTAEVRAEKVAARDRILTLKPLG